jgi:hypothetical protein
VDGCRQSSSPEVSFPSPLLSSLPLSPSLSLRVALPGGSLRTLSRRSPCARLSGGPYARPPTAPRPAPTCGPRGQPSGPRCAPPRHGRSVPDAVVRPPTQPCGAARRIPMRAIPFSRARHSKFSLNLVLNLV